MSLKMFTLLVFDQFKQFNLSDQLDSCDLDLLFSPFDPFGEFSVRNVLVVEPLFAPRLVQFLAAWVCRSQS